jgi:hypothetical protein
MDEKRDFVKKWFEARQAEQRIIDGGGTDHEVLGAITGLPPEAFAFIEETQAIELLAAKITRYWNSLAVEVRPAYMTIRQFEHLFGGKGTGAWKIGKALRKAGWTSRRRWDESGTAGRCRIWMPP